MSNTPKTGVYPCWENQFSIDITGGDGTTEANQKTIADMESFSVSIDNNIEEWKPFDQEGWTRALNTGKKITVSLNGKRHIGDPGNDYLAGLALESGEGCNTTLTWNFPDGAKLVMPCVVSITEWGSGETVNVAPLAAECVSDGKPTFTPAA